MLVSDDNLRGRTVVAGDGRVVGEIKSMLIERDDWHVHSIRVALRREIADQLGTGGSVFRSGMLDIPIDAVASVGATVTLAVPVDQLQAR